MENFTVKKLVLLAKSYGLSTRGKKKELLERISAYEIDGVTDKIERIDEVKEEKFEGFESLNNSDQNSINCECALCLQSIPKEWSAKAVIERMAIVLKAESFPTVPLVLKASSTCHESSTDICKGCFISNQQLYNMQFKNQVASVKLNEKKEESQRAKAPISPGSNPVPLSPLISNSVQVEHLKTRVPRPYKAFDEEHVKTLIRNSPVKSYKRLALGASEESPAKRSRLYDFSLGK